jgi:hypothetical protein
MAYCYRHDRHNCGTCATQERHAAVIGAINAGTEATREVAQATRDAAQHTAWVIQDAARQLSTEQRMLALAAEHRADRRLQAQWAHERSVQEQREHDHHQYLLFRQAMIQGTPGRKLDEHDIQLAWANRRAELKRLEAAQKERLRGEYGAMVDRWTAEAQHRDAQIAADAAVLAPLRRLTVSASFLPLAVGLGVIGLLAVGAAGTTGLLLGGATAAGLGWYHLDRYKKAMPHRRAGSLERALVVSKGLPGAVLVSGVAAMFGLDRLEAGWGLAFAGLIGLGAMASGAAGLLAVRLFPGMEPEQRDLDARRTAMAEDWKNLQRMPGAFEQVYARTMAEARRTQATAALPD